MRQLGVKPAMGGVDLTDRISPDGHADGSDRYGEDGKERAGTGAVGPGRFRRQLVGRRRVVVTLPLLVGAGSVRVVG